MYRILKNSGLLIFIYLVVSAILFFTNTISTISQSNIVVDYNFAFSFGLMIGWLVYKYVNRWLYIRDSPTSFSNKNDKVFQKIATVLRSICFKFNSNNQNLSFLCTFKYGDEIIFQLTHKAHFPELCDSYHDLKFGIALHINLKQLSNAQLDSLDKILNEEAQELNMPIDKSDYYLVNIEDKIRFGTYLIYLIVKDVFGIEHENDLVVDMESEGKVPYDVRATDS
ncbi:MAG: hypothetical protein AAF519_20540 [Bacteroidota bacterium]